MKSGQASLQNLLLQGWQQLPTLESLLQYHVLIGTPFPGRTERSHPDIGSTDPQYHLPTCQSFLGGTGRFLVSGGLLGQPDLLECR